MDQQMAAFPFLTEQQEKTIFDVKNPACPFHSYVGNEAAVRLAMRIAKQAFRATIDVPEQSTCYCSRECPARIMLTGPRSVGKTSFAKAFTRLIGTNYSNGQMLLPFAEVDGTRIKKPEQVLESLQQAFRAVKMPMIPCKTIGATRYYELPPAVLSIDEVHRVPMGVQEGLLKMSEPNDGIFEINNARIDCRRIAMIIATTKPGKLDRAFVSRFPIKIALVAHSLDDLAKIVHNANPEWTKQAATRLARLKPIPREALEIARLVNVTHETEDCSLDGAIDIIAKDLGLQDGCLTQRAIGVLQVLADAQPHGLSKKNLCAACDNMDESEFENEIAPQLLHNQFHPSLMTVSSRHKITEAGLDELRKRNLIEY